MQLFDWLRKILRNKNNTFASYIARVVLPVGIAALVLLTPFAINNFETFEQRDISVVGGFTPKFFEVSMLIRAAGAATVDHYKVMMSSYLLHLRAVQNRMTLLMAHRTHHPLSYVVFNILDPLRILKAICRNRASMAFLIILVNLARKALLWRWEIPKYCSTTYRTLEMALFRSISYCVSSVPRLALVMMPSAILFRWRKSLLFFPKYPLSAYTFLMGLSV